LTVTAALLLINGKMLQANYRMHDRSGNYVPWDWAWNMLQSCDKDAILFTNGDNDTFPLWYLQEVERIRTDVRVVNLSLANTGWYLQQLKNTSPRGAKTVAFGMGDGELASITYEPLDSVEVSVPAAKASRELLQESRLQGITLASVPPETMQWVMKPTVMFEGLGYLRPQDRAVYEIVTSNFPQRSIYFALTVDTESMIGLEKNLRLDGLAYKVVPNKSSDPMSNVNPALLYHKLLGVYRYHNLDNPEISLEETSRRLCANYSPLFIRLALALADDPEASLRVEGKSGLAVLKKRSAMALEVLNTASVLLPPDRYPLNPELAGTVTALYARLGEKKKAYPYIAYLEKLVKTTDLHTDPRLFYMLAGAYRAIGREQDALRVITLLSRELQEPRLLEEFEKMKE